VKDYCLELASQKTGTNAKLNIMREYLQAYALRVMYDEGVFRWAAFLGGTALRFLYGLPRFSEDLDFSVTDKSKEYSFENIIRKIKEEFVLAGYSISASYNDKETVQSSFLRFEGLMYEAGISPFKNQKLSIKIEFDSNPPEGAVLKTDIVNKYFPVSFLSYELSSLFAGKLHALMSRKYAKGRDFFDLGWYLSKWKDLSPNIILLRNALKQTGWKGDFPTEKNWPVFIQKIVKDADWAKVKEDVVNFLENPGDMDIFTKEGVLKLVKSSPFYQL